VHGISDRLNQRTGLTGAGLTRYYCILLSLIFFNAVVSYPLLLMHFDFIHLTPTLPLLAAGHHPIEAQLELLSRITAERVQRFIDEELFFTGRIEGLLIGNAPASEAVAAAKAACAVLSARQATPLLPSELDGWRTVQLPTDAVVSLTMRCVFVIISLLVRLPQSASPKAAFLRRNPTALQKLSSSLSEMNREVQYCAQAHYDNQKSLDMCWWLQVPQP
jgi:hypothetical protein